MDRIHKINKISHTATQSDRGSLISRTFYLDGAGPDAGI